MSHHESHAKPAHPYHLVNPSPMPILSAMSLLGLVTGALLYMHNKPFGVPILGAGFVAVLACMYFWWRDVVKEGHLEHAHTGAVRNGLSIGMALFITSEVMFFVAFFWAFFDASLAGRVPVEDAWSIAYGIWPPEGIHTFDAWDIPFMNTLVLLLSGTTVTWAHYALLQGDLENTKKALWLTVLLGLSFTGLQAFEYVHASFGFKQGIYASTFYMATGFHGAHVIIGTIFLAVCLGRIYKGNLTPQGHLGFEFAAWYWHFVDVVWLFLFVWVYWWGAGNAH